MNAANEARGEAGEGVRGWSRRRAAQIVAARLAELGRPPDLVQQDGVGALYEQADASPARLRALLASALFLASTEDCERVGADHVLRAAALLDPGEGAGAAAAPPSLLTGLLEAGPPGDSRVPPESGQEPLETSRPGPLQSGPRPEGFLPRTSRWPLPPAAIWAACGLFAALVLALYLGLRNPDAGEMTMDAVPAPVRTLAQAKVAPAPASLAVRPLPPVGPFAPKAAAIAPGPEEAGRVAAPAGPVALPDAPATEVLVRYTLGNPGAAAKVEAVVGRLQAMGLNPSFGLAVRGEIAAAQVTYFYVEDQAAASRVAAAAGLAAALIPASGTTLRPPGTIEISIP